jgi:hypothetical protein
MVILIPPAASRWRFNTLPTKGHFNLRGIPPTKVGGVSKFGLRALNGLKMIHNQAGS